MSRGSALCVAVLLLALSACRGAPSPLPRRAPMGLEPGRYAMTWSGSLWAVTLGQGGGYEARSGAMLYVGCYDWQPRTRELVIRERQAEGAGGGLREYRFALDECLSGRSGCGVAVTLVREAGVR